MTPKHQFEEWIPDDLAPGPYDPGDDELSAQVGAREREALMRNPEADQPAKIIKVGNRAPEPIEVVLDRSISDPGAPPQVTQINLRAHLDPQPPSTDRYSDAEQGRAGYIEEDDA